MRTIVKTIVSQPWMVLVLMFHAHCRMDLEIPERLPCLCFLSVFLRWVVFPSEQPPHPNDLFLIGKLFLSLLETLCRYEVLHFLVFGLTKSYGLFRCESAFMYFNLLLPQLACHVSFRIVHELLPTTPAFWKWKFCFNCPAMFDYVAKSVMISSRSAGA